MPQVRDLRRISALRGGFPSLAGVALLTRSWPAAVFRPIAGLSSDRVERRARCTIGFFEICVLFVLRDETATGWRSEAVLNQ